MNEAYILRKPNYRVIQRISNSNLHFLKISDYINTLTIQEWGHFRNITINMKSEPSFMAITGKSGVGKSVFLSAIEYLVSKSSASTSSRPVFNNFGAKTATVVATKACYQTQDMDIFRRSYKINSKLSNCFINDDKVTI